MGGPRTVQSKQPPTDRFLLFGFFRRSIVRTLCTLCRVSRSSERREAVLQFTRRRLFMEALCPLCFLVEAVEKNRSSLSRKRAVLKSSFWFSTSANALSKRRRIARDPCPRFYCSLARYLAHPRPDIYGTRALQFTARTFRLLASTEICLSELSSKTVPVCANAPTTLSSPPPAPNLHSSLSYITEQLPKWLIR